ncbi:MAG: HlyD family type I secretion periplasmic adaptor subunit [Bosea sp. (in: a-proteobacteria)]
MQSDYRRSLKQARKAGFTALIIFGGTFGVWAAAGSIQGAVIGSGQFVVDGNVKKVQHQTGGVVEELNIREGSVVKEGDLLIKLDDTLARASLQIVEKQIDELVARMARLEAERNRLADIAMPREFEPRADEAGITDLMRGENALFAARQNAREGLKQQLSKRTEQLRNEIGGLSKQFTAKEREGEMIERELVGVRQLFKTNLVQITRLSALEREAAALEGQRGQFTASIAQTEGKIAEIELQKIQIDVDLTNEVIKDLRDSQGKLAELSERRVAGRSQLKSMLIRAPASGVVHQLAVHTVGGVISPAEPAMMIVPSATRLELDARIQPQDVDQLTVGQRAVVRVHAFNQRTTPELFGQITRVAADITRDGQTQAPYYLVRVALSGAEIAALGDQKLLAGMQADVYVETYARSPLDFFIKPVRDHMTKTFRER